MYKTLVIEIGKIFGKEAVKFIKRRIVNQKISPKTSKNGTTLVQRRKLINSIKYVQAGNTITILAGGSEIPYARIHNDGGVIKPTHGQYLAIPLTAIAKTRKPRDFENTYIAKGIIWQKNGTEKPVALFKLQKSVTMPKREYMRLEVADLQFLAKETGKVAAEYVNRVMRSGG